MIEVTTYIKKGEIEKDTIHTLIKPTNTLTKDGVVETDDLRRVEVLTDENGKFVGIKISAQPQWWRMYMRTINHLIQEVTSE